MIVPDRFWTSAFCVVFVIITKGERNNGRGLSYLVDASAAFQIEATQQSIVQTKRGYDKDGAKSDGQVLLMRHNHCNRSV